ncbi:MAG TPA: SMC-Scp complex subunit ScpB [Methanocella sp.]|uniref:SMC-Scp complex subunit ScpB n=1 Tax=Methanocella sp. TaxID=2052833 RepID=UPI002BBD08CF|nr:SMC-Scp complex subunit ScpB [Methanocella sp.]HTY91806.1 SMC-Scp complex subunit ScpB [Methanocella sp.]
MDEKCLLEAALFSAGKPVGEAQLKTLLNRSNTYINSLAEKLMEEYRERNSPLEVVRLEGKYALQLKPEYAERVVGFSPGELRAPALRTLSVIAYYQPLQQSDLVDIRGQAAYEHVAMLLEKGLIAKKRVGRSYELTTTDAFCDYFGLTKGDVQSIKNQIMKKAKLKKESLTKWIDSKVPDNNAFDAVSKLMPTVK